MPLHQGRLTFQGTAALFLSKLYPTSPQQPSPKNPKSQGNVELDTQNKLFTELRSNCSFVNFML